MTPLIGGHIEAGTLLQPFGGFHYPIAILVRTQIAMSAYPCDREILLQGAYQGTHRELLLLRPCIGRKALFVQSAFVGDADAVLVVPSSMGTYLFHGASTPDVAVLADKEVIANHFHASCTMAAKEVFLGEVGVGPGGGAVDDEGGYPTHAVMPSAPAIPEAMPMMILKMISHVLFFCCSIILSYELM